MATNDTFDAAASAYASVLATITDLKSQYKQVCKNLADTKIALEAAPLLRIPFDDLKEGIIEFIGAAGDRYAADVIAAEIRCFAQNAKTGERDLIGKPMRFSDIEAAVSSGDRDYNAQFATPNKTMFDDRALYSLFTLEIKDRVRNLMANMTPGNFGYNKIGSEEIGSNRVTRRVEIQALKSQISDLTTAKATLGQKLLSLGVPPGDLQNISGDRR